MWGLRCEWFLIAFQEEVLKKMTKKKDRDDKEEKEEQRKQDEREESEARHGGESMHEMNRLGVRVVMRGDIKK